MSEQYHFRPFAAGLLATLLSLGGAVASESTAPAAAAVSQSAQPANPLAKFANISEEHLVSDTELSDMRGGFFSAEGAQFDFGASVQTLVNGQLALQTTLNWTPTGASVQQLSGLSAAASLSDAKLSKASGTGVQSEQSFVMPAGSPATLAVANVNNGQLQNILINTADNQTIAQNTNIVFTIYNFAAWQQGLAQNSTSFQLLNEIRSAAGLGGSR